MNYPNKFAYDSQMPRTVASWSSRARGMVESLLSSAFAGRSTSLLEVTFHAGGRFFAFCAKLTGAVLGAYLSLAPPHHARPRT